MSEQTYAKITLLVPTTNDWPRPDKADWQTITDHGEPIVVLGCDYLTVDELPADPTAGLVNINHGHEDEQRALLASSEHKEADA